MPIQRINRRNARLHPTGCPIRPICFEKRVEETIALGAKNRETAIKWIHDAEDTDNDDEYLCYRLGLPYTYFKEAA